MERIAAAAYATTSFGFVSWDEVFVSSDKGRREVHYYLKRSDGRSDLAVIGKEKSLRHMSYHYALRNRSPFSASSLAKLKSRREVIDWLNSVVSDSSMNKSSHLDVSILECKDICELDVKSFKDKQLQKFGHCTQNFQWLGSPWSTKKKRRHYQSFQRNGVRISVHDFVYVLAEEDKRLVAYLEDMYEDSRGNKMVVVRWYHKIDEVGIILPQNYNDREIFFSLCLQDLNIECIDGLATVLSPQHYRKFLNEARHTQLELFVCRKQFENDDVKPFDITQVKGYWKQDILRYMYSVSPSKDSEISQQSNDDLIVEENTGAINIRPRKRQCTERREMISAGCVDAQSLGNNGIKFRSGNETCGTIGGRSVSTLPVNITKVSSQFCEVDAHVEVLSQDSGLRGCWFRASVIKKHKNKVKVRYHDIQDASDESNKLEEWILASKVASSDQLGLRMCGRTIVRPAPLSDKGRVSWVVDVGSIVDVWLHDGWWEGIVFQKDSDDRFHVFFPGEKQISVCSHGELRHSQEWLGNGWTQMKDRPDLVPAVLSSLETNVVSQDSFRGDSAQVSDPENQGFRKDANGFKDSCSGSESDKDGNVKELKVVLDLSEDNLLSRLKWNSSKKRRRGSGSYTQKLHQNDTVVSNGAPNVSASRTRERFGIRTSLQLDHENCKYVGDSLFSSSVVPRLTSLVMSR
ncbi:Agenet domain containing protein [Trema orientale]|uniref:Agenet domain containing protein n=1 Tax=Trema orientale TaxID=63057 RepID=A0A2P5F9I2_TREOI|nr:Agenet domain containing protein [Trema orientale]